MMVHSAARLAVRALAAALAPLAAVHPAALAAGPDPPPASILGVEVRSEGGAEIILFRTRGDFPVSLQRLADPPRLVVEFAGARDEAVPAAVPDGLRLVERLLLVETESGEAPGARALVTLREAAQVDLDRSPGLTRLTLRPHSAASFDLDGSAAEEVLPLYLSAEPAPRAPERGPSGPPAAPAAEIPLGPQDLVHVKVVGVDALEQRARIGADGSLSLPVLGDVPAAGLTRTQLEQEIARRLADGYVRDPQVSVYVAAYHSRRVSVGGAVRSPGAFEMLRPTTLLEALALAGGVLQEEAGPEVQVLRAQGGEPLRIERARLERGELEANVPLLPGDLVHVAFDEMVEVIVRGGVARPERYRIRRSEQPTVLRVVMLAGGPGRGSSGKRAEVVRREAPDRSRTLKVNLARIREGRERDLPLETGDIVVVH
jgi:polysaccharide export outer membrane protein